MLRMGVSNSLEELKRTLSTRWQVPLLGLSILLLETPILSIVCLVSRQGLAGESSQPAVPARLPWPVAQLDR